MSYFYSIWKFVGIQKDYMRVLVLRISCDPVLTQILAGKTSKITSEDFYLCGIM